MRIEHLELKAFRSFTNLDLPTNAPRVLIAGVNGTGKTTIREVIKWVLTGRCQGLDGKGAGTEVLSPAVPQGTPEVAASLVLSGVGKVARTAKNGSGGLTVHGFTGTSQTQQLALYAKLATLPAILDAVLDTAAFLNLHHADAKAMVLSLLNVQITLGDQPNSPTYSLAELDGLYQQAFEERKVAKRVLQQMGTPAKPSEAPQPAVTAVDEQLGKLRAQLQALATAVGETAGKRQALEKAKATLLRPTPRPAAPGSVTEETLGERIAELEERLAMLEADTGSAETTPAPGETEPLHVIRRRVEALQAHKPTKGCVLDSGVPCKTARSDFRQAAKLLEAELATRDDPGTPATAPPALVTTVRKELAALTQIQGQFARWHTDEAQREKALAEVLFELESLPNTSAQDQQIATLKTRIQKGEQLLRETQAHWRAVEAYDTAEATREERRAEVDRLETLCATLGPNGVRVQALQEAIGRFETLVNMATSRFGWQVSFALEPWAVVVNGRPIETYSKSEQFRIGIAVQLAIAALSGLQLAVVDELDMLDHQNRAAVTQMIFAAPIEQVFVLSTREPATALPQNPQVLAYRLGQQEGRSVVLERSGPTNQLGTAA